VEPAGLGARLGERFDEASPIRIIQEDQLASVAAIHDVVDRPGILDSQLARHAGRIPRGNSVVNIKNRPLEMGTALIQEGRWGAGGGERSAVGGDWRVAEGHRRAIGGPL
jgi:hypothetical protein